MTFKTVENYGRDVSARVGGYSAEVKKMSGSSYKVIISNIGAHKTFLLYDFVITTAGRDRGFQSLQWTIGNGTREGLERRREERYDIALYKYYEGAGAYMNGAGSCPAIDGQGSSEVQEESGSGSPSGQDEGTVTEWRPGILFSDRIRNDESCQSRLGNLPSTAGFCCGALPGMNPC